MEKEKKMMEKQSVKADKGFSFPQDRIATRKLQLQLGGWVIPAVGVPGGQDKLFQYFIVAVLTELGLKKTTLENYTELKLRLWFWLKSVFHSKYETFHLICNVFI